MVLHEVTNRLSTEPLDSPAKALPPFPPPTPDASAASPTLDTSPQRADAQTVQSSSAFVQSSRAVLAFLRLEHPLSRTVCAGGQLAFCLGYVNDVSMLHVASNLGLAAVLGGGVASLFGRRWEAPPPLAPEALRALLPYAAALVNGFYRECNDILACRAPRKALVAAAALWLLSAVAARVPTLLLLWAAFTSAFVVPIAAPSLAPRLTVVREKTMKKMVDLNEVIEDKLPKKCAAPPHAHAQAPCDLRRHVAPMPCVTM